MIKKAIAIIMMLAICACIATFVACSASNGQDGVGNGVGVNESTSTPSPPPIPLPTSEVDAILDGTIRIGFLDAQAIDFYNVANNARRALPSLQSRIFIDRSYIDAEELNERIVLDRGDERMLNVFIAAFSSFAQANITENVYLGLILKSPTNEDGEYVGLFLRQDFLGQSVRTDARDLVTNGFQVRADVTADNVDIFHRDHSHVERALQRALLDAGQVSYDEAAALAIHIIGRAHSLTSSYPLRPMRPVVEGSFDTEDDTVYDTTDYDGGQSIVVYRDTIEGLRIRLTLDYWLDDGGLVSYQWYEVIDSVNIPIEGETSNYLYIYQRDIGIFEFRIRITNTSLTTGEQVSVFSHIVTVEIIDATPEPYIPFVVFFNPDRPRTIDPLELQYVPEAGGCQFAILENFVQTNVLGNPNVAHIRVDGRFYDHRRHGRGDRGGITNRRAQTVYIALRKMGVTVPIHVTTNDEQVYTGWEQRRVFISVALVDVG